MRKTASLLALTALATSAAGLAHADIRPNGPPVRAPARLDCPAETSDLTRTAQSPDGQWCSYAGRRGETVRLRLAPLKGQTPSQALAATRDRMHAAVPVYREPIKADGAASGDRADIDVPFVHVHANGDQADVRLFGLFHIVSRDHDADVDMDRGASHTAVRAGLRGAEVVANEVGRNNASLVYVLAGKQRQPSGYRAVGYIAKGPAAGPLVVAEFWSTEDNHRDSDGGRSDIDRLIDRNLDR